MTPEFTEVRLISYVIQSYMLYYDWGRRIQIEDIKLRGRGAYLELPNHLPQLWDKE